MIDCIACEGTGQKSRPQPGKPPECTACGGTGQKSKPIPQHSSETNEHYTPSEIVEAARTVMGSIDLDPASNLLAQETVQAQAFYGPGSPIAPDGLSEPWLGNVFLNPPGGLVPKAHENMMGTKSSAALWWATLVEAWKTKEVDSAIFVGFTLEILRSTQALDVMQPMDFPFCVPKSRLDFYTPNRVRTKGKKKGELIDPDKPEGVLVPGGQPAHANVLVYLPPTNARLAPLLANDADFGARFHRAFEEIGRCRI